jgi:hypothetical protein
MTSFQVQQWLRQGIAAAKAGDTERAYELLVRVVDIDEYNEQAWLWLSSVVESDADREVCLENVLAINPENRLAKTGLVHLHGRTAAPELTKSPEPEPPPLSTPPPAPAVEPQREVIDPKAWLRPEKRALSQAAAVEWVDRSADADGGDVAVADWGMPEHKRWTFSVGPLLRRLAVGVLLLLGLAAAAVAILAIIQTDLFDPSRRAYVAEMEPMLEGYQAWWEGPLGELADELYGLCESGSDGWRNYDVLISCNTYPEVACAHLAAHCGTGIEAMRERVDRLASQARRSGEALLASFEDVTPPEPIAAAHDQFLLCVRWRVAEAERLVRLARGELAGDPTLAPACQMFSSAEAEVEAYINDR